MRLDDAPNYTQYSLEELYDVARHINRRRFPERYERVLEEIEKKRAENPQWRDVLEMPWHEWLWKTPDINRSANAIIEWWEQRRVFYYIFVSTLVLCCSCTLLGYFLLFPAFSNQQRLDLFGFVVGSLFGLLVLLIPTNVLFTACWFFDLISSWCWKIVRLRPTWKWSVALFAGFLILNCIVLCVLVAVFVWHNFAT